MKSRTLAALAAAAALSLGCERAAEEVSLDTDVEKLSYIFGQNIGEQFKSDEVEVDVASFGKGMADALAGRASPLSEEETLAVIERFQEAKRASRERELAALAEKNRAAGEKFRAEYAAREGVVALQSGLLYRVLEEGSGAVPGPGDTVEVHYRGTRVDGTEFDSSWSRGQPATFGVGEVIPGWTEALQHMREGARWELVIPPELAYGAEGAGGVIGPEETLVFEVSLLKVHSAAR